MILKEALGKRFVLQDGDRFFYNLSTVYGDVLYFADGQPMEPTVVRGWWMTDHEAASIEKENPPRRMTIEWNLLGNVTSTSEYPQTLTREEYADRTEDDQRVAALYEPTYEEIPSSREPIEGPFVLLEGAPPPDDGRQWVAKLPYELSHHPEYRHLFPGHLEDFGQAVLDALNEIPMVSAYKGGSVYLEVRHERPYDYFDRSGRGRPKKRTVETTTKELKGIRWPFVIEGQNREDAVAAWDDQLAKIVAEVRDAAAVRICGECQGTGIVGPESSSTSGGSKDSTPPR